MRLRPYQTRAVDMLYDWFRNNPTGNPVLELPGGSGKSVIIASMCKDALEQWSDTKILMCVNSKELIAQNASKLRSIWKGAPLGIYSASLNKRELGEPILYAGIGSVLNRAKQIGHIDLMIVDECDMISHKDEGGYRKLIAALLEINPSMRLVGLTASPFRMGHGLITDGESPLFKEIVKPVTIEELVHDGYLAPLSSKATKHTLSTEGVHKRGNEYIDKELQAAVDTSDNNLYVVNEIIEKSFGRKKVLVFAAGTEHAKHLTQLLNERGMSAKFVVSDMLDSERDEVLRQHQAGEIKAVVNINILSVGYDDPEIDCIALVRPTMSPRLYLQQAVRGCRPVYANGYGLDTKEGRFAAMAAGSKPNGCLVLDFGGNVAEHGPVTNIRPPRKAGSGNGEPPVRLCEVCSEIVHISTPICPCCGTPFPPPKEKLLVLHTDDIMTGLSELEVSSWHWKKHKSKTSGIEMLAVSYYGGLSDPAINEYITILHDGWAGIKARKLLAEIANKAEVELNYDEADLVDIAELMNKGKPPALLNYKRDGKFFKIIERNYNA
jgi:DNA repair protein RadD